MKPEKPLKVIGVGAPILDILVNVDEPFIAGIKGDKGGMELVSSDELNSILAKTTNNPVNAPGGSAANTIFGITELGISTALIGKLGTDSEGEFYKTRYTEMKGDISHFKYHNTVPTGRCLSLITPDSERTMRTDLGAAATLSPEDVSSADFSDFTHVHLEGYQLFNRPLISRVLELARGNECSVSMDLASFEVVRASMEFLPDLLEEFVDIVFANEDEAEAYCGSKDIDNALQALGNVCDVVAVKIGKDGAHISDKKETVKVDAEIVDAIDTTGAGDLWASGFLYGYLKNKTLVECGKIGAILGAEVVQVIGASIPIERWSKIRQRVN